MTISQPARPRASRRALWGVFRLLGAAIIAAGIVGQLTTTIGVAVEKNQDMATVMSNFFSFFTILSNCLGFATLLIGGIWAISVGTKRMWMPRWLSTLFVCAGTYMTITGVVYNVLLRGIPLPQGATLWWANELLHVVGPLLLLIELIARVGIRPQKWGAVGIVAGLPIVWVVYTLIRGEMVTNPSTGDPWWYPYPFLNPYIVTNGYIGVAAYVLGIAAVTIVVASLAVWWTRRRDLIPDADETADAETLTATDADAGAVEGSEASDAPSRFAPEPTDAETHPEATEDPAVPADAEPVPTDEADAEINADAEVAEPVAEVDAETTTDAEADARAAVEAEAETEPADEADLDDATIVMKKSSVPESPSVVEDETDAAVVGEPASVDDDEEPAAESPRDAEDLATEAIDSAPVIDAESASIDDATPESTETVASTESAEAATDATDTAASESEPETDAATEPEADTASEPEAAAESDETSTEESDDEAGVEMDAASEQAAEAELDEATVVIPKQQPVAKQAQAKQTSAKNSQAAKKPAPKKPAPRKAPAKKGPAPKNSGPKKPNSTDGNGTE